MLSIFQLFDLNVETIFESLGIDISIHLIFNIPELLFFTRYRTIKKLVYLFLIYLCSVLVRKKTNIDLVAHDFQSLVRVV